MYLSKKTYVGNKWRHERGQSLVKVVVPKEDADKDTKIFAPVKNKIKDERISEIVEEVGYWRKANQIHQWFVDNCQDGEDDSRDAYVSQEDLVKLLETCKKVLKASKLVDGEISNGWTVNEKGEKVYNKVEGKIIQDPSVAKELLPTREGFFFGGTDYDEYYLDDIKDTIKIIEPLIEEGGDFYYHSSW